MRLVVRYQTGLDLDTDADTLLQVATLVCPKVALPPLVKSLVSHGVVLRGGPVKQLTS